MEKIREFLDVKSVNEIKRTKEKYVELAYEVRTSKKSSSERVIAYLSIHLNNKLCGLVDDAICLFRWPRR